MKSVNTIAIIGGSGLYDFEGLENVVKHDVPTPFGKPSDQIISGDHGNIKVLFLARHGRNHTILPSEVNYRANIYALKSLGAKWCVGVGAVGSLCEEYAPGHIVVPDQVIDWTKNRKGTFFGDGIVAHVSMAEPFCPVLRELLLKSAMTVMNSDKIHSGGTILTIEGPMFSSRAESHLYRSFGAKLITMTNMPEARLAREAEIAYAPLSLVTDYDCWKEEDGHVEVIDILKLLKANAASANKIVLDLISTITDHEPSSIAVDALAKALITDFKYVSSERLVELKPIVGRYINSVQ